MRRSADNELTDRELSELLAAWTVPDPPQSLRAHFLLKARGESMNTRDLAFSLPATVEMPWYKSLSGSVKNWISPPKLPLYQVTSKPVEMGSIWGAYAGGESKSGAASVLIHVGAVALLLLVFQTPKAVQKIRDMGRIVYVAAYQPKSSPAAQKAGGGGGGGQKMATPVSRGATPRFALKQFIPPALMIEKPLMPVTPTIAAQAPTIVADQYGDPLSKIFAASGGPGQNGLGAGRGGGLGSGDGNGYGSGSGGGIGGGAYRVGGDVSAPILISKVEPEYSEEARKAKYSGMVLLSVVVDEQGVPTEIRVIRPLGLGLDEKAIAAVTRWRFRPGFRNGRPVRVVASVEVSFRLL